ncbi:A24 family peptidase C-terminal domain-containing protein [Methanobacterium oryzae]|uniref:A24 family peptidase C-terminal domain-containing protein n=1 Tax=Methanobacterium oryzae TaxID=69540 RepID=UPI003D1F6C32
MILDIPLFCAIIAIITCIYASYSDLKLGIIPNKLTFPLIGLGITLNAIYAYTTSNIWFIILCIIFTAIIFALGYLLWKIGAWAGGDVKLFTALAALLPAYPLSLNYNVLNWNFPFIANYGFPLTLVINSILSILPFLLIYIFYIAIRSKRYLLKELFSPITEDYKKNIVLSLVITSAVTLTIIISPYLPYQMIIISLILIYLLTMIISKLPNQVKAVVISILIAFALYNDLKLTIISIIVLFISITIIRIIIKMLTSVNKKALQDDVEIENLKEGMILANNVYENDKGVYIDDKGFFDKIKESIKSGDVNGIREPKGKLLIGSMAAGLTDEDIRLLKKLKDEKKIENKIRTKRGIPFAPSILLGLIISLFIGDLALILQKIVYMIYF